MTDAPPESAGGSSPLPGSIQSDVPLGFGFVTLLVGLIVAGGGAAALELTTPEELGVILGSVVVTALVATLLAALSDARAAPAQRDDLHRAVAELRDRTDRLERGEFDVAFDVDRDDEVGALAASLETVRDRLRDGEDVGRSMGTLEETVDRHTETTTAVADGDLTERFEPAGDHESIDELARRSNAMLEEIEETFTSLKKFSGEVVTYSGELTASMQTVRAEGERTSETLSTIEADNDAQHDQLRTVEAEIETLSTTVEEIAAVASNVADTAGRAASVGAAGSQAADDALEGMREIDQESRRTLAEIERLEAEAEAIDDLVDSISEIARQTKVLAVNANLEATRSSAADERFTVVANEVKEFSEQVHESVSDVEQRLEVLRDRATAAGEEVRRSRGRIEENSSDVERAAEALEEIAEFATRTNDGVQEISAATQQQAASTEEVVAMVEDAAETSGETADSSSWAATRAAAQADALGHVAHSATVLTDQARKLNDHLEGFRTEEGYDLPEARVSDDVDAEEISTEGSTPGEIDAP